MKPKVFISYSNNSKDNDRVKSFSEALSSDGVEVIIDNHNLKPGQDINAFMGNIMNDSSLTNILVLLTPEYAEKSDNNVGGVGVEQQYLAYMVLNDVKQTKVIPIVVYVNLILGQSLIEF